MRANFIFVVFFIVFSTYRVESQTPVCNREKLLLDYGWRFNLGDDNSQKLECKQSSYIYAPFSKSGLAYGNANVNFIDTTWRKVDLPHDWAVELDFVNSSDYFIITHGSKPIGWQYPKTSIGWYRKTFTLPKQDDGKRISVKFDGIARNASVWVNDFYLGNNESGYSEFSYDITDIANYGGANVIAVKVDASQFEGWWYEGAGIYRHTWLIKHNSLHIPKYGTYITTDIAGENANVNIENTVFNQNITKIGCQLNLQIIDETGKVVGSSNTSLSLNDNEQKTIKQQISVQQPELWSIERPYLYKLISTVKSGNTIIDQTETAFGIRTIAFDPDKGFFLNGKSVKIKGTCNHQDHAGVGVAMPDRLQYYRVERLKEMGCNAYRSSHNPPTIELLEACDRLGMLVLDENRMLSATPDKLKQFEELILRDRNHPSIIAWCIGNEELIEGKESGKRIGQTLKQLQHKLDPSRLCTFAGENGNQYEGVNSIVDIRGFNYFHNNADEYHKEHPTQCVWGSEVASTLCTRGQYFNDSTSGFVCDYDLNVPGHGLTAEKWWTYFDARPWLAGGFVWTGFDYRGEPTPYELPCISSHFGIMDVCGFPKNNYYYYQSWWSDKDVIHLFPHWNWQGKIGETIDVWCNTNCESVELFLNGKSQGTHKVAKNSHAEWKVIYEPGTLEVKGIRNGKTITDKVETTGIPVKLFISPDRTTIKSDGEDLCILTVTAVDDKGRDVPIADNSVLFKIVGNGKIIGVGNGNPSSHEADKLLDGKYFRKLFNGKCQVIVQSGTKAGNIIFKAMSNELKAAEIVIKTENAVIRPSI